MVRQLPQGWVHCLQAALRKGGRLRWQVRASVPSGSLVSGSVWGLLLPASREATGARLGTVIGTLRCPAGVPCHALGVWEVLEIWKGPGYLSGITFLTPGL